MAWCRSHGPWPGIGSSRRPGATARGVVQLGRRDQKRLCQWPGLPCARRRRSARRGGEANPVELAVHLGQDVGSAEGGPALGHPSALPRRRRRPECRHPGRRRARAADRCDRPVPRPRRPGRIRCTSRPAGARIGHLGQAVVLLGRPGFQVRPRRRSRTSTLVGWRPWRAAYSATKTVLRSSMAHRALGELSHQHVSGHSGHLPAELVGVAAGPTVPAPPQLSVNRSLSTPWCSSERATTLLNNPANRACARCRRRPIEPGWPPRRGRGAGGRRPANPNG
jgi:hypothetical protein